VLPSGANKVRGVWTEGVQSVDLLVQFRDTCLIDHELFVFDHGAYALVDSTSSNCKLSTHVIPPGCHHRPRAI
jgi:hypothetical protein